MIKSLCGLADSTSAGGLEGCKPSKKYSFLVDQKGKDPNMFDPAHYSDRMSA
jgi:hypothetical protein